MNRTIRTFVPALALLAFGPLGACGDDDGTGPPPPPSTGTVEVTTVTTGGSIDADGYMVAVAGGTAQAIGTDAVLTVDDVEVGATSVELTDVAANCTVGGENPRTVQVTDGGVAATAFVVTCEPIGSIEVTTSTTGGAIDEDGYAVSVVGGEEQPIGANATLTVDEVPAGSRSVVLTGVADNCTVAGDNPRELAVTADATVSTTFEVSCLDFVSNRIAITTDRDGDQEIYLIDPDGSNPVNLTNNPADDLTPAISPDGTRIAFTTDRAGDAEIYVMNVDGTGLINLTNNAGEDRYPSWSPDGTRLTFTSDRSGDQQIWVMDADGSNLTNLTSLPGTANAFSDWSPDGTQIAFTTDRVGDTEVYVMDADGLNPTNLTESAGVDGAPTWSPDGTQIAFLTSRDGDTEVYAMDADGSNPTNLTNHAASDEFVTWSPDGSQIAFTSDRGGDRDGYVMSSSGGAATNITNNAADDIVGLTQGWR